MEKTYQQRADELVDKWLASDWEWEPMANAEGMLKREIAEALRVACEETATETAMSWHTAENS